MCYMSEPAVGQMTPSTLACDVETVEKVLRRVQKRVFTLIQHHSVLRIVFAIASSLVS